MRLRRTVAATIAVVLVGLASPTSAAEQSRTPKPPKPPKEIDVQLLALNDFHGNLAAAHGSARAGSATADAGGAEYLATHIAALEATNPRTRFVVSAGDLIGASPLLSALFHDEPTIEAMNEIGLDFNAVGNHEFDEGADRAAAHAAAAAATRSTAASTATASRGADFEFLAANVVGHERRASTLFPPYADPERSTARRSPSSA